MIDLDALERHAFFTVEEDENDSSYFLNFRPVELRALIAELRAARKVVATARTDVQWLMQAVLDRTEWTAPDGCPEHLCEFETNPEKGACSFHEGWFGIADRYGLFEWLGLDDLQALK